MSRPIYIDFRLLEVSLDLDVLEVHLKHIEEQMEQSKRSAKHEFEAALTRLSHLGYDYEEWLTESHYIRDNYDHYVDFQLPRILCNPFLISLYTVYETTVTEIANLIQKKRGQTISLSDNRRGDFLDRARKYYEQELKFELSKSSES